MSSFFANFQYYNQLRRKVNNAFWTTLENNVLSFQLLLAN